MNGAVITMLVMAHPIDLTDQRIFKACVIAQFPFELRFVNARNRTLIYTCLSTRGRLLPSPTAS
jgi:hypothetical protein